MVFLVRHLVLFSFLLYVCAIALHTLSRAGMAAKSEYGPWNSLKAYVGAHLYQLIPQWFLGLMLFLVLWDNAAAYGPLQIPALGDTPLVKLGLAGVLGWFSDSILDKLLGLLHLEKKPDEV